MDYSAQSLRMRIGKVVRYTRLYGPRRTLAKIRGQYHMKRVYGTLPAIASPPATGGHVGFLGCGNFAYSCIAYYLRRNYGHVIRATMDVDVNRAASLCEAYRAKYYTDDAQRVIADPQIDLVYIVSNHASHAEYAIRALAQGKSVHIEKPHVVNDDQLERLCAAMTRSTGRVNLGFNRPYSPMGALIRSHLQAQPGAAVMNWFVAGHDIPADNWYHDEQEGGRVLGNLCHWTDFVLQLVAPRDRYPLTINPTSFERSDCDLAVTFTFGDGTIAAITFSSKGHTFEGVRERFSAQRGDLLVFLDDFARLSVEVVQARKRVRPLFRDHGHQATVKRSYEMVRGVGGASPWGGCSVGHVWETGNLFLRTKDALETGKPLTIGATAYS